jgi:hypothetical protein
MSEPDDDKYLDGDKYFSEILEILKQKFDAGNTAVILTAVYQCALMRKPLPEWLREAFIKAYELAAASEIEKWEEVFGPARKEGAHLNRRREYAELRVKVAFRVALRAPDESIEPDLFAKIGSEFGIGRNKARDAYYKYGGKELHETIEPLVPFLREKNLFTAQHIEPKHTSGKK